MGEVFNVKAAALAVVADFKTAAGDSFRIAWAEDALRAAYDAGEKAQLPLNYSYQHGLKQGRLAGRKEMAEQIMQACTTCRGSGKYQSDCRFCGDSTYDHNCEYETYDCDRCRLIRKLAEKEPGDE